MVVQNPTNTKLPVLRLDAAVSKPEFDGALPCAVLIQETADGFVPSTCMNPGLFGVFPSSITKDHMVGLVGRRIQGEEQGRARKACKESLKRSHQILADQLATEFCDDILTVEFGPEVIVFGFPENKQWYRTGQE